MEKVISWLIGDRTHSELKLMQTFCSELLHQFGQSHERSSVQRTVLITSSCRRFRLKWTEPEAAVAQFRIGPHLVQFIEKVSLSVESTRIHFGPLRSSSGRGGRNHSSCFSSLSLILRRFHFGHFKDEPRSLSARWTRPPPRERQQPISALMPQLLALSANQWTAKISRSGQATTSQPGGASPAVSAVRPEFRLTGWWVSTLMR